MRQTRSRLLKRITTVAAAAALLLTVAPPAIAQLTTHVAGEAVEMRPGSLTVKTQEGKRTFMIDAEAPKPDDFEVGDKVIVRYADDEALAVFDLDHEVAVSERPTGERRAVYGTVQSTSTEQVIVNTPEGGQVFAIQVDQIMPPLPEPGDKVAVVYRVQTTQTLELAKGEELVILPDDFRLPTGEVEVSSAPMVEPEPAPEPTPEPIRAADIDVDPEIEVDADDAAELAMREPEPSDSGVLPQTASPIWLIGALGALSLTGGLAARRLRR